MPRNENTTRLTAQVYCHVSGWTRRADLHCSQGSVLTLLHLRIVFAVLLAVVVCWRWRPVPVT